MGCSSSAVLAERSRENLFEGGPPYGDDDSAAGASWCHSSHARSGRASRCHARGGRRWRHAHLLHRGRRGGVGLRAERRQRRRGAAVQLVREAMDGGRAARRRPQGEEGHLPRWTRTRRSPPSSRGRSSGSTSASSVRWSAPRSATPSRLSSATTRSSRRAVHPHGVFYNKDSEGAQLPRRLEGARTRPTTAVPSGGTHTYTWEVPERAGPTAARRQFRVLDV